MVKITVVVKSARKNKKRPIELWGGDACCSMDQEKRLKVEVWERRELGRSLAIFAVALARVLEEEDGALCVDLLGLGDPSDTVAAVLDEEEEAGVVAMGRAEHEHWACPDDLVETGHRSGGRSVESQACDLAEVERLAAIGRDLREDGSRVPVLELGDRDRGHQVDDAPVDPVFHRVEDGHSLRIQLLLGDDLHGHEGIQRAVVGRRCESVRGVGCAVLRDLAHDLRGREADESHAVHAV